MTLMWGKRCRHGGNDADVGETTTMRGKDAKERKRSRGRRRSAEMMMRRRNGGETT